MVDVPNMNGCDAHKRLYAGVYAKGAHGGTLVQVIVTRANGSNSFRVEVSLWVSK